MLPFVSEIFYDVNTRDVGPVWPLLEFPLTGLYLAGSKLLKIENFW